MDERGGGPPRPWAGVPVFRLTGIASHQFAGGPEAYPAHHPLRGLQDDMMAIHLRWTGRPMDVLLLAAPYHGMMRFQIRAGVAAACGLPAPYTLRGGGSGCRKNLAMIASRHRTTTTTS